MSLAETKVRHEIKFSKPKKYCNIFYNNDKTPFDVVIYILINIFNYTPHTAVEKAKEIHEHGSSNVFISSKSICDTKKKLVSEEQRKIDETHLKHTVELYSDDDED